MHFLPIMYHIIDRLTSLQLSKMIKNDNKMNIVLKTDVFLILTQKNLQKDTDF